MELAGAPDFPGPALAAHQAPGYKRHGVIRGKAEGEGRNFFFMTAIPAVEIKKLIIVIEHLQGNRCVHGDEPISPGIRGINWGGQVLITITKNYIE